MPMAEYNVPFIYICIVYLLKSGNYSMFGITYVMTLDKKKLTM